MDLEQRQQQQQPLQRRPPQSVNGQATSSGPPPPPQRPQPLTASSASTSGDAKVSPISVESAGRTTRSPHHHFLPPSLTVILPTSLLLILRPFLLSLLIFLFLVLIGLLFLTVLFARLSLPHPPNLSSPPHRFRSDISLFFYICVSGIRKIPHHLSFRSTDSGRPFSPA